MTRNETRLNQEHRTEWQEHCLEWGMYQLEIARTHQELANSWFRRLKESLDTEDMLATFPDGDWEQPGG